LYENNKLLLTLLASGKTEMDKIRNIIREIEAKESNLLQVRQGVKDENHHNLKTPL